MLLSDLAHSNWLRLIRAEYEELPGMSLTKVQVQRLWGLDGSTCEAILDQLVKSGFLRQTRTREYVRAGTGY
jgi:DNA-binding IclR family transcriptional regulator